MRPIDADAYADHLEDALKKSILEVDTDSLQRFLIAATLTAAVVSDLRDETITPTIDVEPVRHGYWILTQDDRYEYCTCSECGFENGENWMIGSEIPYCQNCGAKMDKGGDDGADS